MFNISNIRNARKIIIRAAVAIAVAGLILVACGLFDRWISPSPRLSSASELVQKPPLTTMGGADPPTGLPSAPPGPITTQDRAAVEEFLTSKMHPEVRVMRVTAYCSCKKCCGPWADVPPTERRLACGLKLWDQLVTGTLFCAAPSEIPFHAAIAIPGYNAGFCVPVLDRGGAITGDRLDVFIPDHAAARVWGAPLLQVEIYYTQDPPEAEADSPDVALPAFTTEYE